MFTLIDEDIILPLDGFIPEAEREAFPGGFYPAFMRNSQTGGQTRRIPFQRSTPVMHSTRRPLRPRASTPSGRRRPGTRWSRWARP